MKVICSPDFVSLIEDEIELRAVKLYESLEITLYENDRYEFSFSVAVKLDLLKFFEFVKSEKVVKKLKEIFTHNRFENHKEKVQRRIRDIVESDKKVDAEKELNKIIRFLDNDASRQNKISEIFASFDKLGDWEYMCKLIGDKLVILFRIQGWNQRDSENYICVVGKDDAIIRKSKGNSLITIHDVIMKGKLEKLNKLREIDERDVKSLCKEGSRALGKGKIKSPSFFLKSLALEYGGKEYYDSLLSYLIAKGL